MVVALSCAGREGTGQSLVLLVLLPRVQVWGHLLSRRKAWELPQTQGKVFHGKGKNEVREKFCGENLLGFGDVAWI